MESNEPSANLDLEVGPCAPSDFDRIFPLLRQLWPNKSLDREILGALFREAHRSDSRTLLRAAIDGQIVGFASMTFKFHFWHAGRIGWVDELVVDQEHRGLGIGQALLEKLTAMARKQGCTAMELDSAFHRTEAHEFYAKAGFEKRAFLFSKPI